MGGQNTFSHFPNVDGLPSFQPSAAAPLHSPALCATSSICQPPHHYPVMTLPFQFIPALSLPLPWPSFWNSRKRAASPPLLPSRSVSLRQHVHNLSVLLTGRQRLNSTTSQAGSSHLNVPVCSSRVSQVFQEMWKSSGKTARHIIQEKDLGIVSDAAQLHGICQKVVDSHPDEVIPAHTFCTCLLHSNTLTTVLRRLCFKMVCHVYVSVGSRYQEREPEGFEQADGPGSERD